MALPKLNNSPRYELKIPSSNKTIRYRPFLMKEEKNLLIAMESKNTKTIFGTLLDTINACVEDDNINDNTLTSFDVEYMFLQMRAKSVGETAKVGASCTSCEKTEEIQVKLDDIKINMPDVNKVIDLDGSIKLEVDWPAFKDIIKTEIETEEVSAEQVFKIMKYCFKSIITEEEKINLKEVPESELNEFIDSMDAKQFGKIREFVELIPKLEHTVNFTCECGHENELVVEGVANFLF